MVILFFAIKMPANRYLFSQIRRERIIYATIFLLFSLSCQSVERFDYVKPLPAPKKKPSEISIGYEFPPQKYLILSKVTIRYSAGYPREQILQRLQQIAAQSGADGMVLLKINNQQSEFLLQGGMPGSRLKTEEYQLQVQFYRLED